MAVVRKYEAEAHATVNKSREQGWRYTCPWIVEVDNARDDGQAIVEHFESTGYGIDSTLRYADMRNDFVFCESIAPSRMPRSKNKWSVILTYTPIDEDREESRPGEGGELTDNPFDWRLDIQTGVQMIQVPVWKAWNYDQFPDGGSGGGYVRPVDTLGPVVNSAGVVLDPPLLTNVPEMIIGIQGYLPELIMDYLEEFPNKINDNLLQWHTNLTKYYEVAPFTFDPYTVKCSGVSAAFRKQADIVYWQYNMEFRYRPRATALNPLDGWLETVLDRGLTKAAEAGDPDGLGGQYGSADIEAGMAPSEPIAGPDGRRVGELVLLDGHGQPLTGDDAAQGVYFRWRVNPVANFTDLPFKIFKV